MQVSQSAVSVMMFLTSSMVSVMKNIMRIVVVTMLSPRDAASGHFARGRR